MIPEFNELGLLPAGIHQTTLEEFEERFARFDRSDRRLRIFDRIRELFDEIVQSNIVLRVLVGGSYVSEKAEPNDFDCIVVLAEAVWSQSLRPFEYRFVSHSMAKKAFGGDVFSAVEGTERLQRLVEFFQTTREGHSVGLVEIEL